MSLNIHEIDDVSYRTVVHVAIIEIKKVDISSLKPEWKKQIGRPCVNRQVFLTWVITK